MNNQSALTSRLWRRCLAQLLALVVGLSAVQCNIVYAQQAVQDIDAPLIEHEQIESGELGETQVFTADVTDNTALETVSLYYRFAGDEQFEKIAMQPVADSSFYSANVSTDHLPEAATSIEYYLQAADAAGNVVLKGYIFEPLTRNLLVSPASADALASATAVEPVPDTPAQQPISQKKNRTWYYVLGAVGLVALAALAGGGGGGDDNGGSTSDCGAAGCQVNLVVNSP